MVYHVGFSKQGKTLVIEARKCVDFLSCELYDYMGQRETTKAQLKQNRYAILCHLRQTKPDVYGGLKYAIVN